MLIHHTLQPPPAQSPATEPSLCGRISVGLPAHKSRKMKQYLESQRSWLEVEMLPGYCPDLNPMECLWGNIKGQELANRCVAGLGEAEDGVSSGMARVRQSKLPFSFLHHAGLFF